MRISDWSSDVCSSDLSGRMVERRDQVLIGFLPFSSTAASTFLIRCASTNGPFLIERDMLFAPYLRLRRETIILRSEEHTSELQSLVRNSYAVFCLKKKNTQTN